ncbi:hypothetical protein [Deinococcus radiotolerans]|uniref:XRE family transcriptional regulator n=1 Tax=Deinococcus radiotolerans TaxID=1309407 RepID=A0ABQ2FFA4_9DEIO|nr:hypothetical protein [Deinococcus radiotolerans]GGK85630.1 hypothetical protein GCM10010844_00160 [Deinococcus radiotolerans]
MPTTAHQITRITAAHAQGLSDAETARYAGVSLSTVKRLRVKLGLTTFSERTLRGRHGEGLLADMATARGLRVTWSPRNGSPYDLQIGSQRVDVKTSMQRPDGTWRFRLPPSRPSFHGTHRYPKNYGADCDLLALVALRPGTPDADIYFIESRTAPENVVLRPGGVYDSFRNDWTVFEDERALAA